MSKKKHLTGTKAMKARGYHAVQINLSKEVMGRVMELAKKENRKVSSWVALAVMQRVNLENNP